MNASSIRGAVAGACAAALLLSACGGGSDTELTASAKALLAKKDTRGAVIQLKSALQKNPKSAEARFLLGKTLLEGGDPVAALVELHKAQELQAPDEQVIPELARGMLLVGEEAKVITQYGELTLKDAAAAADLKTALAAAYAVQGDKEKAQKATDDALRFQPNYAPALIMQARLAAAQGDLEGALRLLDDVLGREPGNERAGVLKGDLQWHARGEPDAALVTFHQVLAANPGSVAAQSSLANILLQQKKFDGARAEVDKLKKSAPNHPDTLLLNAQMAFVDGDYKTVRDITERMLKAFPDNLRVLELAGAAEYRMKQYVLAEALLGRALKNAPKVLLTRQLLAQTYLRSGQPNKAIEVLEPVIESAKADGPSLALVGEAYLQIGDAKRSEEAYQRALKAAPGDTRVRTSAAVAQIGRGNSGGAIAELEAIASGDASPRADLALVSAKLRQKDLAGALKAIDALEKKLPDQAMPLNLRGRVLLLKQDIPGATKSFQAALAKDASYFPAVASLAAIDLNAGKADEARKRFDDFLKVQPKSYQAMLALAELNARTGAPAATVTALLKDAAKLNPSEPKPHLILINRLLAEGDSKAALTAAQDAGAALPNNLDIMEALGRAQLAAGDPQRAITTFKKVGSLNPRNPLYEMRLADAYMAVQDRAAAASSLRHVLELQPDLFAAKRGLAMLAALDKRHAEGIAIARQVQQRNPKDGAGFLLEGEIEATRKNWDAAASAYRAALQRSRSTESAIKLHAALVAGGKAADAAQVASDRQKEFPKDAAFAFYLGDVALAQKDFGRAEQLYRTVVEVQPNNALALNNVAWLMVKQGKPGAIALAEKANATLPNRAPLLDTLASALEFENQLPKAIETQKRAIAIDPKDGMLTLHLAQLFIKQGDKPRARAELESLAKLGDKFPAQADVAALLKTL